MNAMDRIRRPETSEVVGADRRRKQSQQRLRLCLVWGILLVGWRAASPAAETLIPSGSIWKYSAAGADPGPGWAAPGFNDVGWAAGAAQLGFGDGDEATVLNSMPGGVRLITAYFRRTFNHSIPATTLTLRLRRDDGAVVYLNGTEAFRDNMPSGPVTYSTLASAVAVDDGNNFIAASLPPSLLVAGENVLAVEVHQNAVTSSDLSFDLELIADDGPPPPEQPTVTVTATDPTASEISPLLARPPDSGSFTFTRTGSTGDPLTVLYAVAGTATNGVDYVTLPGSVLIPAGANSASVSVEVLDDAQAEPTESLIVRILPSPCSPGAPPPPGCYQLGVPSDAVVSILDDDPPPPGTSVTLVPAGTFWSYLDNGSSLEDIWRGLDFDDSAWKVGQAQLGYGDGDEVTVVDSGPAAAKYITTYFRRTFALANAAAISNLSVRVLRDDGGVVYLNGVEVFRSNLPPGPITASTLATFAVGGPEESTEFIPTTIGGEMLREGLNVVAVEIHQVNPLSSDLSFDLELVGHGASGQANLLPAVRWLSPARRSMFSVPTNITLTAGASDPDGQVARVEFYAVSFVAGAYDTNRVGVADASASGIFSVVWTNPPPRLYTLFAQAVDDRGASASSGGNLIIAVVTYPVPPTVSLMAVDAEAAEADGNTATFRVARTPAGDTPLVVYFDLGGSAQHGSDYAALHEANAFPQVVIPAHATAAQIAITPLDDDQFEATEDVSLSLRERPPGIIPSFPIPDGGYFLETGKISASVSIADNDAPGGDREVHAIGIYSGITSDGTPSSHNEPGEAAVEVRRPGKRVTLVLSAYEPVLWHVTVGTGTVLERIILAGYYRQTVEGVGPGVEQIPAYFGRGPGASFSLGTTLESGEFFVAQRTLCAMTGLDLTSFQGRSTAPFPEKFLIDQAQIDPRLRCDYPEPAAPETLPEVPFQIAFKDPTVPSGVRHVTYTLAGAEHGGLLFPGPRLTPDGGGRFFYGVEWQAPYRVDAQSGAVQSLPLEASLPPLSWPTGTAYDSQRDRILLASFGGEGFLYGYSPTAGTWSLVSDLDNHDIDCLVYHPPEDALYGVTMTFGGASSLTVKRFSPNGAFLGRITLPVQPFGIGINSHRTHLVSAGDYLVLLIEPDRIYPEVDQLQESRIYLIEPASGQSWLTYRQIHAPRPHPPEVEVIWPGQRMSLPNSVPLPLIAQASDSDGLADTVEFFVDEVSLGFGRRDPDPGHFRLFRLDWSSPSIGSHRVTARVTDATGFSTRSSPVHVTVREGLPEPEPARELHAVGILSGTTASGGPASSGTGHAAVVVNRPGKRISLFLSSYEAVLWHVRVTPETILESIILGGYERQTVEGVSSNVVILPAYYDEGRGDPDYLQTGYTIDSPRFQQTQAKVCQRTGQDMASFQGMPTAPYPAPFVIDRVQLDARLRCDYPRPIDPAHLPGLSFRLTFLANGSSGPLLFQDYTLAGLRNGSQLLPATRVVTDAQGRYYYGDQSHEMLRVDSQTGAVTVMDLGPDVPELSWPIGVTYDSARNRVLLASLGGEGLLYAYSPGADRWSLVRSLENRDLDCIVYHPADDSLYAISASPGEDSIPSLRQLTPDGAAVRSLALPILPVSLGFSGARSELVSVGEFLVWLVAWDENTYPRPAVPESRIYLIDPRTGEVSLTFRGLPVPDQDGDGVPDAQDQCPNTPDGVVVDGLGCSAAQRDADGDGVSDEQDRCPGTPAGVVLNADGCSLEQLCPCQGEWRNHAEYVRCAIDHAWRFNRQGLIDADARRAFIRDAVRSDCGRRDGLDLHVQPQTPAEVRQEGQCLVLSGTTDAPCILECSVDLRHWIPIRTNQTPALEVEILDLNIGTAPARFYRVRSAR